MSYRTSLKSMMMVILLISMMALGGIAQATPVVSADYATEAEAVSLDYAVSSTAGELDAAYHIGAGFAASNPEQGYDLTFGSEGVTLEANGLALTYALSGFGYGDSLTYSAAERTLAGVNRVEYGRGTVTEWYVNGPEGVQQGYTFAQRPAGYANGWLTVAIAVGGDYTPVLRGSAVELVGKDGSVLTYGGLLAYDATGKLLPVALEVDGNTILLRANDVAAVYPVTIDPIVQQQKLNPGVVAASGTSGRVVAIDGDYAVVGARAIAGGRVFVYQRSGATWTLVQTLQTLSGGANPQFGDAVAISLPYLAVGAITADSADGAGTGEAYIYELVGGSFVLLQSITADTTMPAASNGDFLGSAVAFSPNGSLLFVGAPLDDRDIDGLAGDEADAGSAYIFELSGGQYTFGNIHDASNYSAFIGGRAFTAADNFFGAALDVADDGTVIIGALSYDGLTPAVPENGLAFAAQYDTATNTFTISGAASVLSAGVGGGIRYGSDVDLSTTSAIVGSETGNRARIYDRAGASMTLNTTLTGAGNFGAAVEIDANRALVGAPTSGGIGAVFHYLPGSPWTAAPAAQTTNFTSTSAASGDQFGASIAMDGAFVLVGAPFDDTGSVDAGSAYIFSIPEITVSDVTVTEGNSVVFTFTRNDGGGAPITINYTFNAGTTEASDRGTATPASGFLCSTATCTVTITTVDDAIYDDPAPAETLSLTNITATVGALLNPVPVNGSTAAATVTGTINDNEGVPVLSIVSPAAQPENVTPQIFVVQLSHARETGTVTFNCRTQAATASNIDGDYTPFGPGLCSVNIPAGDTSVDLPVALLDDLVNEPDEFYTVAIGSPTNATLGNTLGIGYIEDDDPTPSVSVSCPATVQEGDAGTQAVVCTITLSGANSFPSSLTVSVNPVPTEADATDIIQVTNQTVNIPAGTTSVQFIAQVVGDIVVEDDEDFTVTLDNLVGVVAGTTTANITIVNDDTAVATILVNNATIPEAGGTATFTVSLSKPAESGFTVSLGYSGTATNGVDATPFAPVSVSCLANVTVCDTVTLTAVNDTVFEGPETATLTILPGAGYTVGLPSAATTTIIDNDGAPGISLDSCTLGDEAGPTHITCTVSIPSTTEADASASFVVIPGTASTPQDYSTSSGLVTIPAGNTSATFTITVVDDTWFEGGLGTFETMTVILTNPVNATASSDMSEQASIQDNEDQPTFALVYDESILGLDSNGDPISEPEGVVLSGVCVDMITGNTAIPLEIGYFLYNGTALAGEDYQYVQDSFIIAAGTDAADSPCDQNIPIDTIDDLLWEGGPTTYETLFIELFEVDPALSFLGSALSINIEDNELVPPTLRILDAQVVEGNAGTTNLAFVVQLVDALGNPAPAGVNVTFDYISAAGTAANGADYNDVSGTATIVKGQTSATVLVPVLGDLIDEENETLTLTGSNPTPTGITFSDATAIGTIIDDDNAPALSVSVAPASDVETDANNIRTVTVSVPADSTSQVINFNYTFVGAGTTQAVVGLAGGCPAGTVDVIQNSGSGSITPVIGVSASFSTTFTVTVCGDNRVDADTETAGVRLSGVTNVNPNTSVFAADFDIIDDDTGTAVLTGPATIAENAGVATYTVTLQDDLAATMVAGTDVTVTYSVTAGTATAAVDYIAGATGSVVIPAGSSSATFTVLIVNDAIDEIDETYTVALTGATGNFTAGDITATGSVLTTITDDDAAPVISIDDVTVVEGTGGVTNAVFTISQSTLSSLATSVTVNTTAGTAISPADFTAIVGATATIPAGQLSTTVSVNIVTDSLDEVNETFTVDLTAPVNATLGDASGLGTIIDDDDAPLLTIADELVIEGNAGSVNVTFDLSLSAASDQAISFSYYFVANGTATQGTDYTPGACVAASVCTSTFPANSLTHTFTVNNLVVGDTLFEDDETFGIVILPDNLGQISAFSDLNGVVTIQDDDAPVGLNIDVNDASVTEGNSVQTLITLSQTLGQDVTVTYRFDDVTAVTPGDYQDQNDVSVVIPAGSTSVAITIYTNQDTLFEVAETFNIVLTTAIAADTTDLTGNIVGTPGVVTINDDGDAQPVVTIGDLALNEGNPIGLTTFNFPVTLNTASGVPVIVNWTRNVGVGVSAAEASDFDAVAPGCGSTTGSVTIPAGQLSAIVPICVIQDAVYEPDENFWLSYTVTNGSATPSDVGLGTILNDDLPPTITINSVTVTEGNIATLTITRTGATEVDVTGTFATADVTATVGLDYSSTSGSFTIAASLAPTATTTVTVTTLQDVIDEPSETLNVVLSNLTGSSTTSATGVVTIDDDDAAPTIVISDAGATEGQLLTFTITLSNPSASTVTVDYATNTGTASATDYVGVSGTLTFLPGELTKILTVESVQDLIFELTETFTVDLTNPVNATIADGQGVGTITDNDAAPMVFSAADFSVTEGNAGTTTATITVTLSNPSYETIDLTAALTDALATITGAATCTGFPVDYSTTLTALPISFAPGVTTATVTFDVCGDVIDEANEDVLFTINGTPVAGTITSAGSDLTTVVTIVDDDETPTVQIVDVTASEATTPFAFQVILVDPVTNAPVAFTGRQITFGYTIAEGTAIEPQDYTGLGGSLIIPADLDLGANPQFINVPVINDTVYEATETFTVTITSAINAVLTDNNGVNAADPLAVGTIIDDDAAPLVTITYVGPNFPVIGDPTIESDSNGMVYEIELSAPAGVDIEVGYYTGDVTDTATEGVDYGSIEDRITIPAGSTSYTVYVSVVDDLLYEGGVGATETVTVFIYNTDNSPFGFFDQDTGEIEDNDGPPSITINDVTVVETAGGVNAVFTVTQSVYSGVTTGFTYALSDITATGGPATALGVDYINVGGAGSIAPGYLTTTISVPVEADAIYELDETYNVTLSAPVNATLSADVVGLGTIINSSPMPTVDIGGTTLVEGTAGNVVITRNGLSQVPIVVNVATGDLTAIAPGDYVASAGTGTIPASLNATESINYPVATVDDTIDEPNELFTVTLNSASNAVINASPGVVVITDNDAAPTISISDVTAVEGQLLTFTLSLSNPSAFTVTVDYALNSGTATEGVDFVDAAGTLTFAPGITSITLTVESVQDLIFELTETFTVDLTNPVNSTIADAQGVGTITDNDGAPVVTSAANFNVIEGNAGTTTVTINVTLSNPSYETITLTTALTDALATITGAATCTGFPVDYVNVTTPATVTFAPGSTTASVTFDVCGDVIDEDNEDVTFTMTPSVGVITLAGSDLDTVVTIVDDDETPTVQIVDVTASEATTPFAFQVILVDPVTNAPVAFTGRQVTFGYTITEGSAIEPEDYTGLGGSLIIPADLDLGANPQFINVPVIDDAVYEATETFTVTLTSAINAVLTDNNGANAADPLAIGTILDNDAAPTVTVTYLGPDNLGAPTLESNIFGLHYQISLSAAAGVDIPVNYYTFGGTASEGLDYIGVDDTIVLVAGQTVFDVYIPVIDDLLFEGGFGTFETVVLQIEATVNSPFLFLDQDTGQIEDNDVAPTITINDVTVVETAGGINAVFTVTQSALSGLPTGFTYALTDITATGGPATALGVDYINTGGAGTIPAGFLTTTIIVPVEDDAIYELTETYNVTLSAPVNATLSADVVGLGTIINSTPMPTVSIFGVTITEGGTGIVAITRNGMSQVPTVVNVVSSDITAISGVDYAPVAFTGTIVASLNMVETVGFTVTALEDLIDEPQESFRVAINSATNATVLTSPATVFIDDNDAPPTISISDATAVEGQLLTFTLTLSNPSAFTVTVDYALNDGTAVVGDYVDAAGTLTFNPGVTSITLTVESVQDLIYELAETFTVDLTNPVNSTIADAQGVGTITDNDAAPQVFSAADFDVVEGNAGSFSATVTVTLSNPSYETIELGAALAPLSPTLVGAATCTGFPVDVVFVPTPTTLTFAPGVTTATATIDICGDIIDEDNEDVLFNVVPVTGTITVAGSDFTTVVTIIDDDTLPLAVIDDVTQVEETSPFVFTVTLLDPQTGTPLPFTGRAVTIGYTIAEGTALEPEDYIGTGGTIVIPANTNLAAPINISVPVINDLFFEADETFIITLDNVTNATLVDSFGANSGDPVGVGTIVNTDTAPSVSVTYIGPDTLGAPTPESDVNGLAYTITLNVAAGLPIEIAYISGAVTDTATAGADYTDLSDVVVFQPGVTSVTVYVPVINDLLYEGPVNETVTLSIATTANTPAGVTTGLPAVGEILDDDAMPSLTINDVQIIEGNAGSVNAVLTVTQSAYSGLPTSFQIDTVDVTATGAIDYTPIVAGIGTIPAGYLTTTISVPVLGDNLYEGPETFNVVLTAPVNATIADDTGVVTIIDNDNVPRITITANPNPVLEAGGNQTVSYTISLSNPSAFPVSFDWATADGTASSTHDYAASSGSLVVPPNFVTMIGFITVNVFDDALFDLPTETYLLNLTNIVGADIPNSETSETVSIIDNDPAPFLNFVAGAVAAVEGTNLVFTAQLTSDAAGTTPTAVGTDIVFVMNSSDGVTVPVARLSQADYTDVDGTLYTIVGNGAMTSIPVIIPAIDDLLPEYTENVTAFLSLPTGSLISLGSAAVREGQIIDTPDPDPTVSIEDATVTEGATLDFVVSLSYQSGKDVTVDVVIADVTTSPTDYTVPGVLTVTIPAGSTTALFSLPTVQDLIYEADETLTVTLVNPVNATILDGVATGTIVNDDVPPTITINSITIVEGNAGTTTGTLTVTLSQPAGVPVTLGYATSDGTATLADNDYVQIADQTLTIPAGVTTATITVTVNGDLNFELDETFNVVLSIPVNGTLGAPAVGVVTITNDDVQPTVDISGPSAATFEGTTDDTYRTFTFTLTAESYLPVTVNYNTVDGTLVDFQALALDNDYEAQTSAVVFAPGETVRTIQVRVYADNKYENDEDYSVQISGALNATVGVNEAFDTILNDDQMPTVTMMSDLTVIEDVPTVYVTATLSNPSGFPVIVDVTFVDGPVVPPSLFAANNPADYVPGAATITFNPGETVIGVTNNGLASAFVTSGVPAPVAIVNDAIDEYNENFTAILTGPGLGSGPVLPGVDLDAVITIIDDDRTPKLQVSDVSVPEAAGVATVTFSLVNPDTNAPVATGRDVVIRFSLADGTAFVVDDYLNEVDIANPLAVNQTCTSATLCTAIIPGDGVTTSTSIDITIVDDTIYENPDQFFFVNVEDATNVDTLTSDQQGIVTIIDNDVAPTLDIQAAVSVNEGDSGVTPMTFNITLSAVAEAEISFVFRTMDGDILTPLAPEARVNDADYVEIQPMVVTIPPLAAGTTVTVQVLGDLTYELDEYLTAEIFGAVNATIGNNYGIGEIVNDDLAPVINIVDSTVFEGNAGTSPIVFTVNLTHPVTGSVIEAGVDVTFTVDTADGTATLADVIDGVPSPDYVAVVAGGPYTIVEGQSSTNITLYVNGDTKFESDEIFLVTVTPDTNAIAGDVTAEGTIVNDDLPPTISINDVSVVETNAGTVNVSFILTLSNAAQFAYPMPYRTFDGVTPPAATVADNDYNAQNSIYTLPQDVTSATFTVVGLVNGDTKFELDDQFTFEMLDVFGPGQPQFSKNVSVVTILNDDTPPVVTVNSALVVSTPEGNGPTMNQLVYTAVLSNATYQTLVVPFDTSDGTATIADLDYQQVVDGAITFAENALTQTFAVNVVGDNKYELDETVNVTLDALGTGAAGTYTIGAPATHFGTIVNDDAAPTVTLANLTGTEGTPMLITATLSNPSYEAITVTLNTVSGGANPATAGADYTEAVGVTLTFPASVGLTNNLVSSAHDAAPVADGLYELPENFLGTITAGTGAVSSVQATNATFTIISNDPIPTLEINDVSDLEGDTGTTPFVFTVTQSAISGETTSFQVFTADGTAKATAADYAAIVGTTYTIPEGSTTVTVTVNVNGDVKIEEDETFFVNLSNLVHAVAATDGIGDGIILNDDAAIPIIPGGSQFGFESGLGTWKKFTPTNTNNDDRRRCGGSVEGNCYFRFKGLPDEDSRLITTIPANQIPVGFGTGLYSTDDALRIALYYRTGAAQPRISVKVRVFFNDGTPDLFFGILGQGPSETFGPTGGYDPEDWREISTTSLRNYDLSDPELEGLPSTAIRRIRILIRHETNSAKIDIDDIRLDILPSEALPRGGTEGNFSNNTRNGAILTLPEAPDGFRGGN